MLIIVRDYNATASVCDELQGHPGSSSPSKAAALGLQLTDSGQLSPPQFFPVSTPEGWLVGKALGERAQLGKKGTKRNLRGGVRNRPGPEPACDRPELLPMGTVSILPPTQVQPLLPQGPSPTQPCLSEPAWAHTLTPAHMLACATQAQIPPPLLLPAPLPQLGLIEQ